MGLPLSYNRPDKRAWTTFHIEGPVHHQVKNTSGKWQHRTVNFKDGITHSPHTTIGSEHGERYFNRAKERHAAFAKGHNAAVNKLPKFELSHTSQHEEEPPAAISYTEHLKAGGSPHEHRQGEVTQHSEEQPPEPVESATAYPNTTTINCDYPALGPPIVPLIAKTTEQFAESKVVTGTFHGYKGHVDHFHNLVKTFHGRVLGQNPAGQPKEANRHFKTLGHSSFAIPHHLIDEFHTSAKKNGYELGKHYKVD